MIGLVTIGQAPRNDVARSMLGPLHTQYSIQTGALDLLNDQQIHDLEPREEEPVLVTRLRDEREVVVAKPRILGHLQKAIERVERAGATIVCVLCTGEFEGVTASRRLIFPDKVLKSVIDAILPSGTIGVMMPHARQETGMVQKWGLPDRRVIADTASPYSAAGSISDVGRGLEARGAELIVMDCMGYTLEMRESAESGVSVPVILSNSLVGSVLTELGSLSRADKQAV